MPSVPAAAHDPAPLRGIDRALVVGLGISGRAAARALHRAGVEVTVVDDRPDHADAEVVRATGIEVVLGRRPVEVLRTDAAPGLVVPSPGVPDHAPVLVEALERGLPVWSEPELALRLYPRRLLAVTGTNGKTTTTEVLAAMLAAGGLDAVACGNLGAPVTDAAATSRPDAVLVAELSSYQLRFSERLRAEVGVLLNLAPDHLDWHRSLSAYGAAKARIWRAQRPEDWAVTGADDPATGALADEAAPGRRATFSGRRPVEVGVGVEHGDLVAFDAAGTTGREPGPLLEVAALPVTVEHHVANVAAAATAAWLAGVPRAAIAEVARHQRPGRHRLEPVARRAGVSFVDDSKATNVHAAAAALRSTAPLVWLAGGQAKGVDLSPLAAELSGVRAAIVFGEAARELERVCAAAGVPAHPVGSIEAAVALAAELAQDGDTVLLAPACASFDQFRDYVERGERFAAAARALPGARAEPGPRPGGTS